jgi:hypothetical protein
LKNKDFFLWARELREWYRIHQINNYRFPIVLISLGSSLLGSEESLGIMVLKFIVEKFFNYNFESFQYEAITFSTLRNLIAIFLIIIGIVWAKEKAFPKKKDKAILITHEVLEGVDFEELKQTLPDFELKQFKIDLKKSCPSKDLINPQAVYSSQIKLVKKLPKGNCIYYGRAHIPLTVALGYQVRNRSVTAFDCDHATRDYYYSWKEAKSMDIPKILKSLPRLDTNEKEVALKISFSVKISNDQIKQRIGNSIKIMALELEETTLRSFKGKIELDKFIEEYRKIIEDLKERVAELEKIHLFIAAPPPIPLRIGSLMSKTHDPEFIVYNYTAQNGYEWGISIQSQKFISGKEP